MSYCGEWWICKLYVMEMVPTPHDPNSLQTISICDKTTVTLHWHTASGFWRSPINFNKFDKISLGKPGPFQLNTSTNPNGRWLPYKIPRLAGCSEGWLFRRLKGWLFRRLKVTASLQWTRVCVPSGRNIFAHWLLVDHGLFNILHISWNIFS